MKLREVASISSSSEGLTVVTVIAPLNKECLQDITDWSHIWLIWVNESEINCTVCELHSRVDRQLTVSPMESIPASARIVDIKPYHPLENIADHAQ